MPPCLWLETLQCLILLLIPHFKHYSRPTAYWMCKNACRIVSQVCQDNLHDTGDGRTPAPFDIENIPLLTGFCTSQVVQDFFHQQYVWHFNFGRWKIFGCKQYTQAVSGTNSWSIGSSWNAADYPADCPLCLLFRTDSCILFSVYDLQI